MSPIGDRHAAFMRRLIALLSRLFAADAIVDAQDPIIVGSTYAPQPDVALLLPTADYYASRTPAAADCLLVVEVSESSAEFDRQIKAAALCAWRSCRIVVGRTRTGRCRCVSGSRRRCVSARSGVPTRR